MNGGAVRKFGQASEMFESSKFYATQERNSKPH